MNKFIKAQLALIRTQKEEIEKQKNKIQAQAGELQNANESITKKNVEITQQKEEIQTKNESITASINYAQRIQNAVLPSEKLINEIFPLVLIFFLNFDLVFLLNPPSLFTIKSPC